MGPEVHTHSCSTNSRNCKVANGVDVGVNRIFWVDMEMTGLDIENDQIMEIACLVTDSDLNIVAEGPEIVINHTQNTINQMGEWCTKQHSSSGLIQKCLDSKISLIEAEQNVLDFAKAHLPENTSPLAGNSVYVDRGFLRKYMPKVDDYLHYRIIDVSTIKELCRRWNSEVYKNIPKKDFSHRALQDIKESVQELQFYRNYFFKLS
ncbi:unnamed protein product [Acanthoscelides obtectus]|nr:unnamed protein product [Acanthoscelides obtectus]CAK1634293.1 Oligoribonuclease, mitochondrial [Acanthoscelides obtectus]